LPIYLSAAEHRSKWAARRSLFDSMKKIRDVDWVMPTTSGPGFDGITNVAISVRVTSDKPIVVGANFEFNGDIPSQCSLLPK
jgi:hypothetical protein